MTSPFEVSERQPLLTEPRSVANSDEVSAFGEFPSPGKKQRNVSIVRARLKFIFPALAIGIFLAAGDQTIVVSSYGRIGSDLDELDKVAWLATAYLCTTTAFQPLYGKLTDIFGRKACLLSAYCIFGLGALLCGLAQNMDQLIVARALTGIGAGGIITVVSILLSDIVTLEERGIWQGYVNMVFACGAGAGAPLGGILTDAIGWRWAFIAQAPLCMIAISLVAVLLQLPTESHHQKDEQKTKIKQVDFLGAVSLIACLVLLLVFLDTIASDRANHLVSYLWLISSAVCFVVFLWVENSFALYPLTPLRILFGKNFLGAYIALAFGNVAWYGIIFYVPLLYQAIGHLSASAAGTLLLPGIGSGVIGGFIGGTILKRRGATGFSSLALASYPLVAMASVGVALGAGFFARDIPLTAIVLAVSISLFVGGLGNGGGMAATLVVVIVVASPEDQAVATACVYLYRQLGTTIGLAIISLVFRRVLASNLIDRLVDAPELGLDTGEVLKGVSESLEYLDQLPIKGRIIVEAAYGKACRAVFLVCAGLAICAFISSWFINESRVEGQERNRPEEYGSIDEENGVGGSLRS
ncbi:MFS general substrate transporter [Glarea lozoyensis ATCC 20868]|uniref:MFS general substrate transporter n=1 Tax=Glarea lozoyensis (strain ATCC 20868 / MF5171) TaxID=1116229 RepID=S3CDJ6_GLAL2|nr:MFS general substrate transporter [Glarea lozoyensis ATCC 20868]EPE24597.1 MFS general substrate transporter [Glarea lozoyensis ATCC 20868]